MVSGMNLGQLYNISYLNNITLEDEAQYQDNR